MLKRLRLTADKREIKDTQIAFGNFFHLPNRCTNNKFTEPQTGLNVVMEVGMR